MPTTRRGTPASRPPLSGRGGERGAGDVLSGRRSGGGRGSAALGPAHVGGVPLRPAGAARLGEHEHDLRADDGRGVCDEWGAAHDLGRGSGAGRDPGADRWGELGGVGQRIPDVSGPVLDVGREPLLRAGGVRAGAGGGPTAERDALRLQGQSVGREPDVAALHVAGVLGRAGDALAGAVQRRGAVPAVHGGGGADGVPGAGRGHGAAVCVRYVAVHGGSVSAGARGAVDVELAREPAAGEAGGGGLIYQRNRLYDPKSGRFTQEDPIGLAGGLNLYGYAGGDPVNFSDPFGLCPASMRDASGKCPGGLSVGQWDRVIYAINNRMTPEAGARVRGLLESGDIRSGFSGFQQLRQGATGKRPTATAFAGHVEMRESAFEFSPGTLAFVLAHESQHLEQSWLTSTSRGRERDADAYACANTTQRGAGAKAGSDPGATCGAPRK
ncbi:MAG: hypothetical protein IPK85_01065 [Gemmatimonadetes bacterium]|nr:hypothetical protein [Gemmatimonadota bacterium]